MPGNGNRKTYMKHCRYNASAGIRLLWPQLCMHLENQVMIEKQFINGRDVWLEVEPYHVQRANPNIIPTEYFTAKYYLEEPSGRDGEAVKDEDGQLKLFESPVAALTFIQKRIMKIIG